MSTEPLDFRTEYSREAFDSTDVLLTRAREALRGVKYDTMVCMGTSGTSLVPWLARRLRKYFVIVRKDGESSHASSRLNGMLGARYVLVDDFVETGSTLRRMVEAIDEAIDGRARWGRTTERPEHIGSYLYAQFDLNRHPIGGQGGFYLPGTEPTH